MFKLLKKNLTKFFIWKVFNDHINTQHNHTSSYDIYVL